jgi:hypothetical protein
MATAERTPGEWAAYWQGRHEEAADALAHERSRVDSLVMAAVKWAEPMERPAAA